MKKGKMREIKFRAWDGDSIRESFLLHQANGNIPILDRRESTIGLERQFDWVVEQFTGMKDKDGVEIYEGDIVKTTEEIGGNFISNSINKYCVIFNNFSFQLKPLEPVVYTVSLCLSESTEIEIIGNIHENYELVKK